MFLVYSECPWSSILEKEKMTDAIFQSKPLGEAMLLIAEAYFAQPPSSPQQQQAPAHTDLQIAQQQAQQLQQ